MLAVVCRACLPWLAVETAVEIAVDLAVEMAVEIAMASVMGLHGVPLRAAAFRGSPWSIRGSPWSVRGSPWSVRGCPWNAVEIAVECRGGPWALPRCYAKKTIIKGVFDTVRTEAYRRHIPPVLLVPDTSVSSVRH